MLFRVYHKTSVAGIAVYRSYQHLFARNYDPRFIIFKHCLCADKQTQRNHILMMFHLNTAGDSFIALKSYHEALQGFSHSSHLRSDELDSAKFFQSRRSWMLKCLIVSCDTNRVPSTFSRRLKFDLQLLETVLPN